MILPVIAVTIALTAAAGSGPPEPAPPLPCDGTVDICRTNPDMWPNADPGSLPALCQIKPVFCGPQFVQRLPPPAVPVAARTGRPDLLWDVIDQFGARWTEAVTIIDCESNWNPTARNPRSTAGGLFQFLAGTWTREAEWFDAAVDPRPDTRFDPAAATWLAARVVERDRGWRQWECKQHLP